MTAHRSPHLRIAAVSGAALLAVSGAPATANAQSAELGLGLAVVGSLGALTLGIDAQVDSSQLPTDSLGEGSLESGSFEAASAEGSLEPGSLDDASAEGSLDSDSVEPGSAEGSLESGSAEGSLDAGSLEPIFGSAAPGSAEGSLESGSVDPGSLGVGSLAAIGVSLGSSGEGSTAGSLDDVSGSAEGSLEPDSGEGSLEPGSLEPGSAVLSAEVGSLSALFPVVLVGGSVAGSVIAAPQVQQSVAGIGMGIALPPLPGSSTSPAPPIAEAPPAPGPDTPNGRGGQPGMEAGGDVVDDTVTVMTGSLGVFELALPEGVQLPPLPFIR